MCVLCTAVLLQAAQRTNLWRGVLQGAVKAVQTGSMTGYKAGLEAGECVCIGTGSVCQNAQAATQ
jgi:hypothetical protein